MSEQSNMSEQKKASTPTSPSTPKGKMSKDKKPPAAWSPAAKKGNTSTAASGGSPSTPKAGTTKEEKAAVVDSPTTPKENTSAATPFSTPEDNAAKDEQTEASISSLTSAIAAFAMDAESKVKEFNNLPRGSKAARNHWVFGVMHVEIFNENDLILAVHTGTQYLKQSGPADILSLATPAGRAEALLPFLLNAFVDIHKDDIVKLGPTTWSTVHEDLIEPLQEALTRIGVTAELCKVGVATHEERTLLDTIRERVMTKLIPLDPDHIPHVVELCDFSRCHGCGFTQACFFKPLSVCSRCKMAAYHSRACQAQHWSKHKQDCLEATSPTPTTPKPSPIKAAEHEVN